MQLPSCVTDFTAFASWKSHLSTLEINLRCCFLCSPLSVRGIQLAKLSLSFGSYWTILSSVPRMSPDLELEIFNTSSQILLSKISFFFIFLVLPPLFLVRRLRTFFPGPLIVCVNVLNLLRKTRPPKFSGPSQPKAKVLFRQGALLYGAFARKLDDCRLAVCSDGSNSGLGFRIPLSLSWKGLELI